MALVNPLGDLALDKTVKDLTTAIDALAALLQRQASTQPSRALQYARTATDAMRVNIDNQATVSVLSANNGQASMAGAGIQISPWANNSWNIVDARYPLGEAQITNFQTSRNRWVFS